MCGGANGPRRCTSMACVWTSCAPPLRPRLSRPRWRCLTRCAAIRAACERRVEKTSTKPPPTLGHSSAIPPDGLLYWKQALAVVYAAPSGGRCTGGHAGGETLGHAHLALSAGRPGTAGVRGGRGYGGPLPGAVCGLARLDAHGARLARPPGRTRRLRR